MSENEDLPKKDFSQENPRLHRLYVTYAQEELRLYDRIIRELSDLSRVNASCMAGLIHEERARLIRSDAAYKEAAWRLLANDPLEPDPQPELIDRAA